MASKLSEFVIDVSNKTKMGPGMTSEDALVKTYPTLVPNDPEPWYVAVAPFVIPDAVSLKSDKPVNVTSSETFTGPVPVTLVSVTAVLVKDPLPTCPELAT